MRCRSWTGVAEVIDPPTSVDDRRAFGNNDAGVVAGSFNRAGQHGFVLEGTTFTDVDFPGLMQGTVIRGINNNSDLVGEYDDASGFRHGFTRIDDLFATLDYPGSSVTTTRARAINDARTVAGFYGLSDGTFHGFLWDASAFTPFDIPGAASTAIGGINNHDAFVGVYLTSPGPLVSSPLRGFIHEGGTPTFFRYSGRLRHHPDDDQRQWCDRRRVRGRHRSDPGVHRHTHPRTSDADCLLVGGWLPLIAAAKPDGIGRR